MTAADRMRTLGASVLAMLLLAGCAGDDGSGGEPVAAPSPTAATSSTDGPGDTGTGAQSTAPAEPRTTLTPAAVEVEPGTVDLGEFKDEPQAQAAASFYEQLWRSYQSGEVTPGLARLTTGSALGRFRANVTDLARLGHTVAELNAAHVVQVDGPKVVVCMSSSSYQRLEARTGAAVNPKVPGVTEYVVTLRKSPWRVHTAEGTKKPMCRKASR